MTPLSRLISAATEAADELEALSTHLGLKAVDERAAELRAALADMAYTPPAGVDWNAVGPELLEALKAAETAMNYMGDVLNGMDAVTEDDEHIFPAFYIVRAAIAKASQ